MQIAVDSKHHLIVAEKVTNDGNDTKQLAPMLENAQEVLQPEDLVGLADSGYYDGNQIKACEEQNITVYVAIPDKSKKSLKKGVLLESSSNMTQRRIAISARRQTF